MAFKGQSEKFVISKVSFRKMFNLIWPTRHNDLQIPVILHWIAPNNGSRGGNNTFSNG